MASSVLKDSAQKGRKKGDEHNSTVKKGAQGLEGQLGEPKKKNRAENSDFSPHFSGVWRGSLAFLHQDATFPLGGYQQRLLTSRRRSALTGAQFKQLHSLSCSFFNCFP